MAVDNKNFDSLVSQISTAERKALYQKFNDAVATDDVSFNAEKKIVTDTDDEYAYIDIQERYKSESFFIRFFCTIAAAFSGKKKEDVYKDRLVDRIVRIVCHAYPGIFDRVSYCLKGDSRDGFMRLSESATFFRNVISGYAADRGGFYIVLSSVLIPEFYDKLVSIVELSSIPFSKGSINEIRQDLLRTFEGLFLKMDDVERSSLYNAVRSLEWLRKFASIQYSRIINCFNSDGHGNFSCRLDVISEGLRECSSVLCNTRNISMALLEALFLFNNQVRIEQESCDEGKEYNVFLSSARDHLSNIRFFLNKFPLLEICRIAVRDCSFVPPPADSGEDWFTAFKNAWRKRFDIQWALWARGHKKWQIQERICALLNCEEMPVLLYHPWSEVKESLFFRRELSFVFLRSFFASLYVPKINRPLKLIMMSGEFYKRENYIQYTDCYNELDRIDELLANFEERLSPKGDIGSVFHEVLKDKIITMSGKHRIDSLMLTVDADGSAVIKAAVDSISKIKALIENMMQKNGNSLREVLSNLKILENLGSKQFSKEMDIAYTAFQQALDIERELESVELTL